MRIFADFGKAVNKKNNFVVMKALKALFRGKINKSFTDNVYLWLAFSMIIYLLFLINWSVRPFVAGFISTERKGY
jgi:hypothetical protein